MLKNLKTTPRTGKKHYAFNNAPRCGAKTRAGTPCKLPVIRNKARCRLHGCGKGSGAPRGNKHALKHGSTTAEVKAFKQEVRRVLRASKALTHSLASIYTLPHDIINPY